VKGFIKITLISLGCLLLFIVLPLMIMGYYMSKSVSDSLDVFDDFFDTGYTHEEIKEYVQDEHGLEVEIIENEGKDPNMKGLGYHDAVVESVENDPIEFNVNINFLGNITDDNYKTMKKERELDLAFKDSKSYQQLKELDFQEVSVAYNKVGPELKFTYELEPKMKITDDETIQMLYEALPHLKTWEQEQSDVEINTALVGEIELDLQEKYNSWQSLGDHLASENAETFSSPFIDDAKERVEKIEQDLKEIGMKNDFLECDKMKVRDECAAYTLVLNKNLTKEEQDDRFSGEKFEYDSEDDKENIVQAIELTREVNLPIEKVKIKRLYSPNDTENQSYSREELEEREDYVGYANRTVTIKHLNEISSPEDIYFEY